jgi:Tfp pilus assembly PilM family ATPase
VSSTVTKGAKLRQMIKDLEYGKYVYLELSYNGRIWYQRWTKAGARQLATQLQRVEMDVKYRGRSDEYCCYTEIDKGHLYISWQLV